MSFNNTICNHTSAHLVKQAFENTLQIKVLTALMGRLFLSVDWENDLELGILSHLTLNSL